MKTATTIIAAVLFAAACGSTNSDQQETITASPTRVTADIATTTTDAAFPDDIGRQKPSQPQIPQPPEPSPNGPPQEALANEHPDEKKDGPQPEGFPNETPIRTKSAHIPFPEDFNPQPSKTEILPFPEDFSNSPPETETEILAVFPEAEPTTTAEPPPAEPTTFCQTLLADTIAQKEIEHPNYHFQNSEAVDASNPTDPSGNPIFIFPEEQIPLVPEQIKICGLIIKAESRDFPTCHRTETREAYKWYDETRYRKVVSHSPEGCYEAQREAPNGEYVFCGSEAKHPLTYHIMEADVSHPSRYEKAAANCLIVPVSFCADYFGGEEGWHRYYSEKTQADMRANAEELDRHCSIFDNAAAENWSYISLLLSYISSRSQSNFTW